MCRNGVKIYVYNKLKEKKATDGLHVDEYCLGLPGVCQLMVVKKDETQTTEAPHMKTCHCTFLTGYVEEKSDSNFMPVSARLITEVWTILSAFGSVSHRLICYVVYNSKSSAKRLQSN